MKTSLTHFRCRNLIQIAHNYIATESTATLAMATDYLALIGCWQAAGRLLKAWWCSVFLLQPCRGQQWGQTALEIAWGTMVHLTQHYRKVHKQSIVTRLGRSDNWLWQLVYTCDGCVIWKAGRSRYTHTNIPPLLLSSSVSLLLSLSPFPSHPPFTLPLSSPPLSLTLHLPSLPLCSHTRNSRLSNAAMLPAGVLLMWTSFFAVLPTVLLSLS